MRQLQEVLLPVLAVAPQDIGTADVTGSYLPMTDANRMLAVLTTSALTAGQTATIELLQATDTSGTGAKELKPAVTGTSTAEVLAVTAQVEVISDDFDTNNGFAFFAVKVTCSETGKLGSAIAIKGDLRYTV